MKKFYIILFSVTIIISLIIMFYNPNKKYLGVFKDKITIEYDYDIEGYSWEYEVLSDSLLVKDITEKKWILTPKKDGITNINFYYKKDDDVEYTIMYTFKIKNNKIYWTYGEAYGLLEFPDPY